MTKQVRCLAHNDYNHYCARKLAHYNEWLCDNRRAVGVPYKGFPEDQEFITVNGVNMNGIESMVEQLTGTSVIPQGALPTRQKKVSKAKSSGPKAARKAKTGTKQEAAVAIFKRLNGDKASTISAIMDELGMSTAGATTYFYNSKKLA
jgi:hypothetical protein